MYTIYGNRLIWIKNPEDSYLVETILLLEAIKFFTLSSFIKNPLPVESSYSL